MLCATHGNTREQVLKMDSWASVYPEGLTVEEILADFEDPSRVSIWRCDDNKEGSFDDLENLVLIHDGGAYTEEIAQAEREEEEREWRREIAREEGMLNGIDSYNDYMGY